MFDIGWTEMLILGVVVLLVLGPAEIPNIMFTVGKYVRHLRGLAKEFKSGLESMDVASDLKSAADWKSDLSSKLMDEFEDKPKPATEARANQASANQAKLKVEPARSKSDEGPDLFAAKERPDKR